MGASDPPGTTYIPGLREDLYGLFAINLGVYVPEVAHYGSGAPTWVQDHHCCIRIRLGALISDRNEIWWRVEADGLLVREIREHLERSAFPYFERLSTRDQILTGWLPGPTEIGTPPRIISAIILAERGHVEQARVAFSTGP